MVFDVARVAYTQHPGASSGGRGKAGARPGRHSAVLENIHYKRERESG
jgi:hypothetical protein